MFLRLLLILLVEFGWTNFVITRFPLGGLVLVSFYVVIVVILIILKFIN